MDQRELIEKVDKLGREVTALRGGRDTGYFTFNSPFMPFRSPLTSTSWDGDAFSTTAKTLIPVRSTFTNAAGEFVPDGAKAILVRLAASDSGSAGANCFIGVAPDATADLYALVCKPYGRPNSTLEHESGVVPCDIDGNIYYQCLATGAGTLNVTLQIWGYWR